MRYEPGREYSGDRRRAFSIEGSTVVAKSSGVTKVAIKSFNADFLVHLVDEEL